MLVRTLDQICVLLVHFTHSSSACWTVSALLTLVMILLTDSLLSRCRNATVATVDCMVHVIGLTENGARHACQVLCISLLRMVCAARLVQQPATIQRSACLYECVGFGGLWMPGYAIFAARGLQAESSNTVGELLGLLAFAHQGIQHKSDLYCMSQLYMLGRAHYHGDGVFSDADKSFNQTLGCQAELHTNHSAVHRGHSGLDSSHCTQKLQSRSRTSCQHCCIVP